MSIQSFLFSSLLSFVPVTHTHPESRRCVSKHRCDQQKGTRWFCAVLSLTGSTIQNTLIRCPPVFPFPLTTTQKLRLRNPAQTFFQLHISGYTLCSNVTFKIPSSFMPLTGLNKSRQAGKHRQQRFSPERHYESLEQRPEVAGQASVVVAVAVPTAPVSPPH